MISRFAQQGKPVAAVELLMRVADATRMMSPKQEQRGEQLRMPIRMIFRSATAGAQRELLAHTPDLPRSLARILVAAAAQENFSLLRSDLAALLAGDLPEGVAQQLHNDIQGRSRSVAFGALPRLFLPLGDGEDDQQTN